MSKKAVATGVLLLAVASVVALYARTRTTVPRQIVQVVQSQPHSFAECVKAGNKVLESFPRQCTAGKYTFVEPQEDAVVSSGSEVVVSNVHPQDLVQSPLHVLGTAPGSWFFEANIGLRLLDSEGNEVARGSAKATGEWMMAGPVPFGGAVEFAPPATSTGYLEIQKDNPSDKRELDGSVRIPVRFK